MRAVAVLLCKASVTPAPASNATKRWRKARPRNMRRLPPNARRAPVRTNVDAPQQERDLAQKLDEGVVAGRQGALSADQPRRAGVIVGLGSGASAVAPE